MTESRVRIMRSPKGWVRLHQAYRNVVKTLGKELFKDVCFDERSEAIKRLER